MIYIYLWGINRASEGVGLWGGGGGVVGGGVWWFVGGFGECEVWVWWGWGGCEGVVGEVVLMVGGGWWVGLCFL